MKSIMEEASSVSKAIEKGWLKAGKPKEFSVRVHEQPQKNFFGITTQNAKIAIIFEEKHLPGKQEQKRVQRPKKTPKSHPAEAQRRMRPEVLEEDAVWTSDMISFATKWLKTALEAIGKNNLAFSTQADGSQLLVTFEHPIFKDQEQNKRIIRPISQLLVQTLRNHLKKPLRGYKVILKVAR